MRFPPVAVVAVITVSDPEDLPETLDAVRRQVYEPRRIMLVGADRRTRRLADEASLIWSPTLEGIVGDLPTSVTHLWLVHGGAVPRPDALGALVDGAERTEAAIAGSKLLDKRNPGSLLSVGVATDVFDVPYLGLDPGERDAGQYDVVRDVAAVGGASLLLRRDLARGLAGADTEMGPESAAVDLSQRARLRGARIVVVPSSEVLYPAAAYRGELWREEAGRIRAMLKVYSWMTLAWALPTTFLLGVTEGLTAPFVGRWTLWAWLRAWTWNVGKINSTLRLRNAARRGRVEGDAELFRYQLRGSATLLRLRSEIGAKLRSRLGGDDGQSLADLGRDLRQPALVGGALAVLFVLLATRSIWSNGLPVVGFSLPLPASGSSATAAYAGGWNPAGFGSIEPLPPFIALAGLVKTALLGRASWAATALVTGSFLSGVWGMTRLLRTFDIRAAAGIAAGTVLVAGPASRAIAEGTGVPTLIALGVLPWALRVPLARLPSSRRGRLGRVAGAGWVISLLAVLAPPLLVVPAGSILLWATLNPKSLVAWRAVVVATLSGGLAIVALFPWLGAVDLGGYLATGTAYWEPGPALAAVLGLALVATVAAASRDLATVALWGGLVAGLGALLARLGASGAGREIEHAALAVAALGSALIVGSAIDAVRRAAATSALARAGAAVGATAATLVVLSTLLVVGPGRAGLPADELTDRVAFTAAAEGDFASSRILLVGPADALPGTSRTVRGAAYRVVSAPTPRMWEAWLPTTTTADNALSDVLEAMIDGQTSRAGSLLRPFGIRWVISVGDTPLEQVFSGQLDLVPLGVADGVAFTVEGDPPVRALSTDGVAWSYIGNRYEGPAGDGSVFLAESYHQAWGPGGVETDWGVSVSAVDGEAAFGGIASRRSQAVLAAALFSFLVAFSWLGRRTA